MKKYIIVYPITDVSDETVWVPFSTPTENLQALENWLEKAEADCKFYVEHYKEVQDRYLIVAKEFHTKRSTKIDKILQDLFIVWLSCEGSESKLSFFRKRRSIKTTVSDYEVFRAEAISELISTNTQAFEKALYQIVEKEIVVPGLLVSTSLLKKFDDRQEFQNLIKDFYALPENKTYDRKFPAYDREMRIVESTLVEIV